MRCPTLAELPPPPPGQTGWPWTAESEQLPDTMPGGEPWPKVSIVTPSFNQGQFIEETIRSVLLQGYPNLEYIIIDGGSTDESVEVIKKYEPWLARWVSEKDRGQSHAINKGWRRATGEYVSWLNSDDLLLPESLAQTVSALTSNPTASIVYGDLVGTDPLSRPRGKSLAKPYRLEAMVVRWRNPVRQPGFLMRSRLLRDIGYLNEELHFVMDFEYWIRIALSGANGIALASELATLRRHADAKTSTMQHQRLAERLSLYDGVFSHSAPPGLQACAVQSRRNLHLKSASIAYSIADLSLMKEHAWKHIALSGLHSSPRALAYLAMSAGGRGWFMVADRVVRALRSLRSDRNRITCRRGERHETKTSCAEGLCE